MGGAGHGGYRRERKAQEDREQLTVSWRVSAGLLSPQAAPGGPGVFPGQSSPVAARHVLAGLGPVTCDLFAAGAVACQQITLPSLQSHRAPDPPAD